MISENLFHCAIPLFLNAANNYLFRISINTWSGGSRSTVLVPTVRPPTQILELIKLLIDSLLSR